VAGHAFAGEFLGERGKTGGAKTREGFFRGAPGFSGGPAGGGWWSPAATCAAPVGPPPRGRAPPRAPPRGVFGRAVSPHPAPPRAFDDVDVLIHLAAVISGGEDAQFAGTVVGTERLLDAMGDSACRRLVLCSSFSVYDFSATHHTLDEKSPLHRVPDVYARDG